MRAARRTSVLAENSTHSTAGPIAADLFDIYSHTTAYLFLPGVKAQLFQSGIVMAGGTGEVDGFPCIAVGYAVPGKWRNRGAAKQILKDVVDDQICQAKKNGLGAVYVEAVVDVDNLPSQRVAAAVLGGVQERITDRISGRPAFRYTARYETA